jgi:antitoxin PrlF
MNARARARVTSKGQITVPKAVRDALGLEPSSVVEFEVRDGHAVIRKAGAGILAWYGAVTPRERPEDWDRVRKETADWVGRRAVERAR